MYKKLSKNGILTIVDDSGITTISNVTDENLMAKTTIEIFDNETNKKINIKDLNEGMNEKVTFVTHSLLEGENDEEVVIDDVHKDHPEYEICFSSLIALSDEMKGVKIESKTH